MIILLLTVIFIVISLFVLNEIYLWVVMGNSQEIQVIKGKRNRNKYDAISFGSAYCRYGIDFGDFNGFNFGIGSQFFYYTNKMLQEIAPRCLKKGGTVFLVIADLVFAEEGKGLYGPERYQLILSKKTLGNEFDFYTYVKMRFPLIFNPLLMKRIAGFYYHKMRGSASVKYCINEELVKQAAIDRCNSWCREFDLKSTKSTEIPQLLYEKFRKSRAILTEMIQFCLDNDFKPVLVVTPVSKFLNDELSGDFLEIVLYENIKKSNTQNVPLLNYLRDERFSGYNNYYSSADLLNRDSRLRFTEILLKDSLE